MSTEPTGAGSSDIAREEAVAKWGLSNSKECLAELRDKRIAGFMQGQLPLHAHEIAKGTTTIVFEDGTGFTFNTTGSFWHESREDVMRAIERWRHQLEDVGGTIERLIALAGAK